MRKSGFVLIAIMLLGCASGPLSQKRDLDAATQQEGKVISCSGYKTWQDCDIAAAKACPKGYEVLAKEESVVAQARTLRISCK